MKFTAATAAVLLAVIAAAAPQQKPTSPATGGSPSAGGSPVAGSSPAAPAAPRNAQCAANASVKAADCQAAIGQILRQPSGAACTRIDLPESDYASVGSCKVTVHAEGGNAHCQEPTDVASLASKVVQSCNSAGEAAANAQGTWKVVVGPADASDSPTTGGSPVAGSSPAAPAAPRNAQCAANASVKAADCQAAIGQILRQPSGAAFRCTRINLPESDYASVGSCKVTVHAEGGDAHCQEPTDVASLASKVVQSCNSAGEAAANAQGTWKVVVGPADAGASTETEDDRPVWN